jgi:hypothetical protein
MLKVFPGIALALLAAPLAGQTTTIVQGGGPALQNAITLANDGDTLVVSSGTYDAITVAKGITIRCLANVVINPSPLGIAVAVSGLPQFRTFVMDGGTFNIFTVTGCAGGVVFDRTTLTRIFVPFPTTSCAVSACTGPVIIKGTILPVIPGVNVPMTVANSSAVTFIDCHDAPYLTLDNSTVCLVDCTVQMRDFGPPAIQLRSGSVTVSGGDYIGSVYFSFPAPCPAITVAAGTLTVTGGAVLRSNVDPFNYAPAGPAVQVSPNGVVRLDPSVQLVSPGFTPSITGPVTNLTIPSLAFARPTTGTFSLTIRGEPGSLILTGLDLPRPAVATPFGDLWVDPRSTILDIRTLPPGGTGVLTGPLPALPPYFSVALQSVAFPAAGGVVLGAPRCVVFD